MAKKKPQRMCVSCRVMTDKQALIRLAVNKEGEVFLDPAGKKPGRGAYVCRSSKCLEAALRGRKLDRGLKTKVSEAVILQLSAELEALADEQSSSK